MTGWFLSAKAVWVDEVASAFLGDTYKEVNTGEDSVAKFVIIITMMGTLYVTTKQERSLIP